MKSKSTTNSLTRIHQKPSNERLRKKKRKAANLTSSYASVLPTDYKKVLEVLKSRISQERLRMVFAANTAMVLLYWDIGNIILERQKLEGWGTKVIDRLAEDLQKAFSDMKGLSPRNLKNMRAFAAAWPDKSIVQQVVAQIPWRSNIALLNKLKSSKERLWYAKQTIEHGWSCNILALRVCSNNCVNDLNGFNSRLPL